MREKFTQKRKSLLLYFSLMLLAVVGGTAYAAEVAAAAQEESSEPTVKSVVMQKDAETVDLMAGTAIEKLISDYDIVVELENGDAVGCMTWELKNDVTGEYVKSRSSEQMNTEGKFTFWIPTNYVLAEGTDYSLILTGWESVEAKNTGEPNFTKTITIKGGTAAYKYSTTTLVDPVELLYAQNEANFSLESAEDNQISFTFSDAVTIKEAFVALGFGITEACEVTMSGDNKTANVTIPGSVLNQYAQFVVSILAEGADGQIVKGNNGADEASYISVYVDAKFNLPEATMVDPAPDAIVESIKTIKFGFEGGINDAFAGKKITIQNMSRDIVATSTDISQVWPEEEADNWDYQPVEVIVTFDNEVTEPGKYSVVIEEGVFNLGSQFTAKNNAAATYSLTVDGQQSITLNISVAPQEGEVVSLKDFEFTFMSYNSCNWTSDSYPTLSKDGIIVATIQNLAFGNADNQLTCSLKAEVTEPGTYTLTIPAGAVTYNDDPNNVNTEAVSFTYVIADHSGENVTTTPAAGTVGEIPASIKITFNDQSEVAPGNGNPTLVDQNGNSYNTELQINYEWGWNELELILKDGAISTPGTYTLTIPAGAVSYGSTGSSSNGELTFVYTVTGEGGSTGAEPAIKSVVMTDGDKSFDFSWGEPIAKFIGDYDIVVELENADEVGVMTWEVKDATTGEHVKSRSTEIAKDENGQFRFWIPTDIVLAKGTEYEVIFTGWESTDTYHYGEPNFQKSVTVKGGTTVYQYSATTLVSPAELLYAQNEANFSLESAEDNQISFTFSDAVTIKEAFVALGFGITEACEVTMSGDNKTANVTIPGSVLNQYAQFVVSILAEGSDGQIVKGNNGADEASYISVYVDAKFNLPEVTMVDPAPNATVEAIKTIKFGYDKGINASWMGQITILDQARNVVATSTDIEQVIPEDQADNMDYIPTEVIVSFNNEITKSGTYIVNVPEGVFNLDLSAQGFAIKSNREGFFSLYVDNDSPMPQINVTISPVPGEVASLKEFYFTFNDANEAGWGDGFPTLTMPDGTVNPIKNQSLGEGYNELVCTLSEEVTEPGEYILTLPAGSVVLDGTPTADAYEFKYTIVAAGGNDITLSVAPGTVTEIPASMMVYFNNETEIGVGSGDPYFTNDKGDIFKATLNINWDCPDLNALELKLNDGAITANGTYTLTFPAGCINLSDGSGTVVDYTFVYIIGSGNSIDSIIAGAEDAEVFNAAGILVGKGVKNLKPGQMYIIKGKKFDVRK